MPPTLSVDPPSLLAAAGEVDAESGDLLAGLQNADTAARDALARWVGRSQTALAGITGRWPSADTAAGYRLRRFGVALRAAGTVFAAMESAHAAALSGSARVERPA